jgi:hypothetical protein
MPVLALDARWRFFDLPDALAFVNGRTGLLVRSDRRTDPPQARDFAEVTPSGLVERARGGMVAERVRLYRVLGQAGAEPIVFMPRPRK